jgi:hypothetical protein
VIVIIKQYRAGDGYLIAADAPDHLMPIYESDLHRCGLFRDTVAVGDRLKLSTGAMGRLQIEKVSNG